MGKAADAPRTAVFLGTFDPISLGHLNLIQRGSTLVDRLIVGIGINPAKEPIFNTDERLDLVREVVGRYPNVEVQAFAGLAVHFVRHCGARVIIRGVRSLMDIEAEFTMTLANRKLDAGIETVFLMADEEYSHISSSLIRQIAPLAGDEQLLRFVPPEVVAALRKKLPRKS